MHLCHLAESYLGLGEFEQALESIERGFKEIDLGRDSWFEADLHRVRDRIMQASRSSNEKVEVCYKDALSTAKRQSARLFELRAATDLARHWAQSGKVNEACDLLVPIHNCFMEGCDIQDLKDATLLLNNLDKTSN